ncbi:MAG: TraB/GumN family protein [Rhodobacterales bacterium]|nr:TraB/GumN family protein [Rhodobacterales bacterium]
MTIRRAALGLVLALLPALPGAAQGGCTGPDLIAALPESDRSALVQAADAVPFARGLVWQATRGGQVVHLVGTHHLDDARHGALMDRIAPLIDGAATVLVEAGPEQERALAAEIAARPGLMFRTEGPGMDQRLPPALWQKLSAAVAARGVSPQLAARMQPWYLSILLGVPGCAAGDLAQGRRGLDQRVIARAGERGVPVAALEPFDTVLTMFAGLDPAEQDRMLELTLGQIDQADAMAATLAGIYFARETRLAWEFTRHLALTAPGADLAEVEASLARMEQALVTDRNRAWVPVIEAAAATGPVVAAFGALHLPGEAGVLALLQRNGWTITPH